MKITQTANELIIKETPGCLWLFGLFFAVIGGFFVYGASGGFTNYHEMAHWVISLTLIMGFIGVGVGIWIIYNAPITKVVVNRLDETVFLSKKSLFGKTTRTFSFDQINNFRLIEDKDDEGEPIWFFGLELNDGEHIKITSLATHSEEAERKFVFQTNQFMFKQMPTFQNYLELDE